MASFQGHMRSHSWALIASAVALQVGSLAQGCGDDVDDNPDGGASGLECLPALPRADDGGEGGECSVAFNPNFDRVQRRIQNSCAIGVCHTQSSMAGGLAFDGSANELHELLMATPGQEPLVIPGDPECSPLMARLESTDPGFQMPPGTPLTAAERCAIIQWIADGAEP